MTSRITMPQSVTRLAPYGSLLKRPRGVTMSRRTAARVLDAGHLDAIRKLPCMKCGLEPCCEAAHVRMGSAVHRKRNSIGAKPDDCWTVPLCRGCHQDDPDAQHRLGELEFWHRLGINPLLVCEQLYAVSPDIVRMRAVVVTFIANRGSALTPGAEPPSPGGEHEPRGS